MIKRTIEIIWGRWGYTEENHLIYIGKCEVVPTGEYRFINNHSMQVEVSCKRKKYFFLIRRFTCWMSEDEIDFLEQTIETFTCNKEL